MRIFRFKGDGELNSTLDTGASKWSLNCVKLHLDKPGSSGDFTITSDSSNGSQFDTIIFKQDMLGVSDLLWIPEMDIPFSKNEMLLFQYSNSGNCTFGLEVFWGLK